MQEQREAQVQITTQDLIYQQVQELGKRMDRLENRLDVTRQELNQRMDRLEVRMNKLEERLEKQDEKIEKLADKIDQLRNDLRGTSGNISISNITLIGIALSVIYFVATH